MKGWWRGRPSQDRNVVRDRIAAEALAERIVAFLAFQVEGEEPEVARCAVVIAAARIVAAQAPDGSKSCQLVQAGDFFFGMAENYSTHRPAPGTLI